LQWSLNLPTVSIIVDLVFEKDGRVI
jgi:hypothetical protein